MNSRTSVETKLWLNLPRSPRRERMPMRMCFSMKPVSMGRHTEASTKAATAYGQQCALKGERKKKSEPKVTSPPPDSAANSMRAFSASVDIARK